MFNHTKTTEISVSNEENTAHPVSATDADKWKKSQKVKGQINFKALLNKKKKFIIPAVLILLLIIGSVLSSVLGLGGSKGGVEVSTGTAEEMTLEQLVPVSGVIEGSDSANIFSSANYRISSILVEEGDSVSKGQILATLDAQELKNQYNKAALILSESKRQYESSKQLYAEGAVAKDDYLKAKAAYETDLMTVKGYDISSNTNVISPISGTVTRVNTTVGKLAAGENNGQALFVVENLDNLKMEVKIGEFDIEKIRVGQTVTITSEMLGKKSVKGVVSRISPTGEQKDSTTKEMIIPVVIDVDKGNTNLIAGVSAKGKILIEKKENILTVPIDATLNDTDTDKTYVFIVENNMLRKQEVTTGLEGDLHIEIVGNSLSAGDKVVLSPTFDYYDGMPVAEGQSKEDSK